MEYSKYPKVLSKHYGDQEWLCGETYETLVWNDKTTEKPTKEKMNELYEFILIDEMREKRNKLLAETDFRVLPDYDKDKDLWIDYRQKLRDLLFFGLRVWNFPRPLKTHFC